MFMCDAIMIGNIKWTIAKKHSLALGMSSFSEDIKSLKEDFLINKTPNIPLKSDNTINCKLAAMLIVALAVTNRHWHSFLEEIEIKYGKNIYLQVILELLELKKYYQLTKNDKGYLVKYWADQEYLEEDFVKMVCLSYFDSDYYSAKTLYMRKLAKSNKFDLLRLFTKSSAKGIQQVLVELLPKEDLIYLINSPHEEIQKILEKKLNTES